MRSVALTLAAVFILPSCAALPSIFDLGTPGDGLLPPLDVLFFPKPGQEMGGSLSQAMCAEGTAAYDSVAVLIDEQNAALDENIELFRALYEQHPSLSAGSSTFTAEVDGVQLVLDVTSLPGTARTYTGRLILADGTEHPYLDGALLDDESAGTLTITPVDGDQLDIAWYRPTPDTLDISRDVGESHAVMMIDEEFVRLSINDISSVWKLSTGAGLVTTNSGDGVACWSAGEEEGDFCDTACTEELIHAVLDGADNVPGNETSYDEGSVDDGSEDDGSGDDA